MKTFLSCLFAFCLLPFDFASAQNVTYTFTLTWTDNSTDETGFNIYRDGKKIGQAAKDATSYKEAITGPAKTQYCWEVTAYNTKGESPKSNQACKALPDAPPTPPTAKPSTPTGLTVTIESASAIRMSWMNNSANEASFELRRKTGKAPPTTKMISGIPAGTAAYVDEGLPLSTTYCYQVRAMNSLGASNYSNQSCGTTLAK